MHSTFSLRPRCLSDDQPFLLRAVKKTTVQSLGTSSQISPPLDILPLIPLDLIVSKHHLRLMSLQELLLVSNDDSDILLILEHLRPKMHQVTRIPS